jgi:hypothetical protein
MDAHLFASIKAVGLAGISNVANSPELMEDARKSYSTALHLVNTALKSPTDVTKDSTLLSVMVLSVFETITGHCHRSLHAWSKHISGAAALVKLRGPNQLHSRAGFRLFSQVTASLLMSCVHRELPIPGDILELRAEAARCVHALASDPAWRLQDVLIEFAAFRAELRDGEQNDLEAVLSKALGLDGAFLALVGESNIPAAWRYDAIFPDRGAVDRDVVFDGCYHVYKDYGVAQIWNSMRSCRILLNRTIRDTLLRGFAARPPVFVALEHTALFQGAMDALFRLQADILASVPQYLGCGDIANTLGLSAPFDVSSLGSLGTGSIRPCNPSSDQSPSRRASGVYFILWPLYLVGSMDITTEAGRLWVIKRLQFIGRSEGIQMAIALAGLLEKRGQIQAWWSNSQP